MKTFGICSSSACTGGTELYSYAALVLFLVRQKIFICFLEGENLFAGLLKRFRIMSKQGIAFYRPQTPKTEDIQHF